MRGRPGRGAFRTARPRAGAPAVRPERPAQSCLPAGTWSTVACVLGVSNGGAARRERVRAGATIWRRRAANVPRSSTTRARPAACPAWPARMHRAPPRSRGTPVPCAAPGARRRFSRGCPTSRSTGAPLSCGRVQGDSSVVTRQSVCVCIFQRARGDKMATYRRQGETQRASPGSYRRRPPQRRHWRPPRLSTPRLPSEHIKHPCVPMLHMHGSPFDARQPGAAGRDLAAVVAYQ